MRLTYITTTNEIDIHHMNKIVMATRLAKTKVHVAKLQRDKNNGTLLWVCDVSMIARLYHVLP